MGTKWTDQEVRDFNGLLCANGEIYETRDGALVQVQETPELGGWLDVTVLAQEVLYGDQYIVKCGEASAHGSIGVIVLESLENQEPVWTFVADRANPFDQIAVKGSWVVVLSTSGAVFRFSARSRDPISAAMLMLPVDVIASAGC